MLSFLKNFRDNNKPPKNLPIQMQEYNKSRYTKNLSAFCHAPSVNMYFAQDGHVKLCCHNMEYSIGKYPDQTIEEIWSSEAAKKIRKDMKDYSLFKECNICKADLEIGAFDEVSAKHFDSLPIHPSYPTMMEFLLTNTCNLECVMCKGEFSSLIRQNREKLPPIANVYDDAFISQLRPFIPHLREVRFSGSGEAFLIDVNYKIWDMILEINPQCLIMVQTNGTVLNSRIKDLLIRGNFQIGVSLDSLKKEVFETIRPHARLERVIENIHYFSNYSKERKMKFSIAMCVMRQNWKEMPEFVHFANSLNATATFHKVYHPMEFSLQTLSKGELEEITAFLSNVTLQTETSLQQKNAKHFQYLLTLFKKWESEASTIIVENLTDQEMETIVIRQAEQFFNNNSNDANEAKLEFEQFQSKFAGMMYRFEKDGKKRKILLQMYRSDFSMIFPYFKQFSEEELYALSSQLAPDL